MTHRNYIKCDVCNSVILVRTQIGWQKKHPLRIHCAKCGILISGEFSQDDTIPQFSIIFENAEEVNMQVPDYYIEASGELLTSKIRSYVVGEDEYPLPPYFNTLNAMGDKEHETFEEFSTNVHQFLYFIDNDWAYVRRIHELWINKKFEYLPAQMREYLPERQFPLNNKLETLRGLHQLFLLSFKPVLPRDFYEVTTKKIFETIELVGKANNNFILMLEYFDKRGLLDKFEQATLKITNLFIEKYPFFISTISADFYTKNVDYSNWGTTTTSFEDVKYFYQECFEVIGDIISLVVAFNNLNYRSDFNFMADSKFPSIKTLDDFIDKMKNKGNKIEFCNNDEVFNKIIRFDVNNGLRNAIGHGSYVFDGVEQVITFYSSGEKDKGDAEKISLIEFIKKSWAQMQTIIILIELIYQTRKYHCVFCEGIAPTNPNLLFAQNQKHKKIGRNEPCPCGSGKKYKKCCLN